MELPFIMVYIRWNLYHNNIREDETLERLKLQTKDFRKGYGRSYDKTGLFHWLDIPLRRFVEKNKNKLCLKWID